MNTTPIDPMAIAKQHDILCQPSSSLSSGLSGCLMKSSDEFGILYSTRYVSDGFKKFTVAHELGHYFLPGHINALFSNTQQVHHSTTGFISKDKYEREADNFAAGLLMPRTLFSKAMEESGTGLSAIESLAKLCGTSLTATAIRFARLSDTFVATICSTGNEINFAVMSKPLQDLDGITWISKNSRLTPGTATANFNKDSSNVLNRRRINSTTALSSWFESGSQLELQEEIVGLGEYGRTLTILWADTTISTLEQSEDEEEENILPSQRWRDRY